MGPVSFEAIDLGEDRDRAVRAAANIKASGFRVEVVTQPGASGRPIHRLMVRSPDAAEIRSIVAAFDPAAGADLDR